MVNRSKIIRITLVFLTAIASLWAYRNKHLFPIYSNYFWYKLDIEGDKNLSLRDLTITLSSAKESGYSCKNKDDPGNFAYQEIVARYKKSSSNAGYSIGDCVQLPTGEIIVKVTNSTTRFYIVLKIDARQPNTYHILDIKGETLG